ncbi:UNVERIFIED_ORG: SAM-dependent methyltransferase [Burkholderia sp. 1263]
MGESAPVPPPEESAQDGDATSAHSESARVTRDDRFSGFPSKVETQGRRTGFAQSGATASGEMQASQSDCARLRVEQLPQTEYLVTNRGSEMLFGQFGVYPSKLLEDLKPGMSVLDVGCGGGQLVEELRCKGVQAIGVDPAGAFPEADHFLPKTLNGAADELPRRYFDRILCAWSVFSYYGESLDFLTIITRTMEGLLADNGRIHLGAVVDVEMINDILSDVPELTKVVEVKSGPPNGGDRAYVELVRTKRLYS